MANPPFIPSDHWEFVNWLLAKTPGHYPATPELVFLAQEIVLAGWRERALDRGLDPPVDATGSCKFASLFAKALFGGAVRGNYDHQYNVVGGKVLDLNAGCEDVRLLVAERGDDAYGHDSVFFCACDHIESLLSCVSRVNNWITRFIEHAAQAQPASGIDNLAP